MAGKIVPRRTSRCHADDTSDGQWRCGHLPLARASAEFPVAETSGADGQVQGRSTQKILTLAHYDSDDFRHRTHGYSSFTYLIAIIRISRSAGELHILPSEQLERAVAGLEARLMSWKLRLPREKQKAVTENGEVDHIMLQALIIFHR